MHIFSIQRVCISFLRAHSSEIFELLFDGTLWCGRGEWVSEKVFIYIFFFFLQRVLFMWTMKCFFFCYLFSCASFFSAKFFSSSWNSVVCVDVCLRVDFPWFSKLAPLVLPLISIWLWAMLTVRCFAFAVIIDIALTSINK